MATENLNESNVHSSTLERTSIAYIQDGLGVHALREYISQVSGRSMILFLTFYNIVCELV